MALDLMINDAGCNHEFSACTVVVPSMEEFVSPFLDSLSLLEYLNQSEDRRFSI